MENNTTEWSVRFFKYIQVCGHIFLLLLLLPSEKGSLKTLSVKQTFTKYLPKY